MTFDHKTLMNIVIGLAIAHAVLSSIIGVLLTQNKVSTQVLLVFALISVIVNILIIFFAGKCKDTTM
jgi:hypothetical protein